MFMKGAPTTSQIGRYDRRQTPIAEYRCTLRARTKSQQLGWLDSCMPFFIPKCGINERLRIKREKSDLGDPVSLQSPSPPKRERNGHHHLSERSFCFLTADWLPLLPTLACSSSVADNRIRRAVSLQAEKSNQD